MWSDDLRQTTSDVQEVWRLVWEETQRSVIRFGKGVMGFVELAIAFVLGVLAGGAVATLSWFARGVREEPELFAEHKVSNTWGDDLTPPPASHYAEDDVFDEEQYTTGPMTIVAESDEEYENENYNDVQDLTIEDDPPSWAFDDDGNEIVVTYDEEEAGGDTIVWRDQRAPAPNPAPVPLDRRLRSVLSHPSHTGANERRG